ELELPERRRDAVVVELMDEQDLDAREAGLGRRAKAVVHVQLGPQHRQIGAEAWHQCATSTPAASSHSLTSAAMSSSPIPRARASEKRCSASAPSSNGTPPLRASSWIRPRSFKISPTGVAGLKSREMNRGRLRVIIVEPPNEVPIRSSTTCGSAPRRAPNTAASAMAEVCTPTNS